MTGISAENWQARVEMHLARLASEGRTITYVALAEEAGIPSPHRIHQLTGFLETLMESDARLGLPLRAAIVVSRTDGLPGDGFFDKLEELGLMPKTEDRRRLHQRLILSLRQRRP